MNYYFQAWRRAFDFRGRSVRKEYWSFFLINFAIALLVSFIDIFLGISHDPSESLFIIIFQISVIIPGIAVAVRRMHDQDFSGWYVLVPVMSIIMMFVDGTPGPNRFGPDPKHRAAEIDPESMANRSPVPHPQDIWHCSHCNTRNAPEVALCATCGRPWR